MRMNSVIIVGGGKKLGMCLPSPVIALKSGWHVEVTETGGARLWLHTESLSDDAELRLVFNDKEISSTPVSALA